MRVVYFVETSKVCADQLTDIVKIIYVSFGYVVFRFECRQRFKWGHDVGVGASNEVNSSLLWL